MSEKNGKVTWTQLIVILGIASTILGTLWVKLEKIDDNLGSVKTDIAVIKQQLDGKHLMQTTLIDKNE